MNEIINDVQINNQIVFVEKNNEKILQVVFYGKNRNDELINWHKKTMTRWGQAINYVYFPFEKGYNHAQAVDWFISITKDITDYWMFFDNDSIPLRPDYLDILYLKAMDKETLVGMAGQSNHLIKQNGEYNHPYVYTCGMFLSKSLYLKLGSPSFQPNYEGDTGESLTWAAERLGYNVCLFWPKSTGELTLEECQKHNIDYKHKKSAVGQHWFGFGTTYGQDLFYHQFCASVERSRIEFIKRCEDILTPKEDKVEAIIVCKDYSDCLKLTLKENIKYFDNIVVVTDTKDIETQLTCLQYKNVKCYCFAEWNKNGAKFNKGGAINFGIQKLKYKNWVVFLDSDIIIKENFKDKLIDKEKFYGSYRRFVPSYIDYKDLVENKESKEKFTTIVGHGCGFFQAINLNSYKSKKIGLNNIYVDSFSAEQVDIDMLRKFCKFENNQYEDLVNLNIELWHLGPHGSNHEGRTTSFFDK